MSSTNTEDNGNEETAADNANENHANQENGCLGEQSTPKVIQPIQQSNGESTSTSTQQEECKEGDVNKTRPADDVFWRRVRRNSGRNYRPRNAEDDEQSGASNVAEEQWAVESSEPENGSDSPELIIGRWEDLVPSSSSSDSSDSLPSIDNHQRLQEVDENTPTPKVLLKQKPKHKWFVVKEVVDRQKGSGSRFQSSQLFQQRCYGSLHVVQRLELMYKLEEHRGCVNNINFNQSGSLLTSASDDKRIALWDWAYGKCLLSYDSGHTSNVFQAKFLPLSGDCHIVSCARDGQVRLAVLSNTGVCKNTVPLAKHSKPTHKLATHPSTPHTFMSSGEDAVVMSHDVRANKSSKILIVKERSRKVGLYSIHSNPVNNHEFCVTGEDCYIRLYDRRKLSNPLKKFCPQHLVNSNEFLHVTCAVFNYNGTEILGSFNDDDIYLFDTRLPEDADYVHKYEGHRNSVTVKAVNFFGPRSEFIVSGSDCGNIYFWDKHTESIVQWMRGDEDGVVNCLETHPQIPVIATSGLDSDIKIWVPSCEQEPVMAGLKQTVVSNQRNRVEFHGQRSDPFDGQMRCLWRQILRFERNRGIVVRSARPSSEAAEPTRNSDSNSTSSSEDEANPSRTQCSQS